MLEFFKTFVLPAFTAFIGFLIGHFLAIGRDKRKEFNSAGDEFRSVFNQALVDIHDDYTDTFFSVFSPDKDWIKKHRVAYLNFRHHLRGECRNQYDDAWNQYYDDFIYQSHFDESVRDKLVKDIEHLLEFPEYGLLKNIVFIWEKYSFRYSPFNKERKEFIKKITDYNREQDNNPLP